ncbi:hypothetical protein EYF80_034833 [Liparis tanakae]|uniref:Uncharacterized protein n=1 Tax=Liparis tanakae TaxID=230148 RepID=A0A4Z2GP87_9TELE|nr:hypothetical protein EYF80_034833 [Liparis tanakae]
MLRYLERRGERNRLLEECSGEGSRWRDVAVTPRSRHATLVSAWSQWWPRCAHQRSPWNSRPHASFLFPPLSGGAPPHRSLLRRSRSRLESRAPINRRTAGQICGRLRHASIDGD